MKFPMLVLAAALLAAVLVPRVAWADRPDAMSARTVRGPSGAASIRGLGESFSPNPSTGGFSFAVPLEVATGALKPSVSLTYVQGGGRSVVGAHFKLPMLQISRTRDKGSPDYTESDRFAVSGETLNDELVLVNADQRYYRLKNERSFALFVRHADTDSWTIRMTNGETAHLGTDPGSRQETSRGTYRWLVRSVDDGLGHRVEYDYEEDGGHSYLTAIRYQLHASGYENAVRFEYEPRPDPFTDYGYGQGVTCRKRLSVVRSEAGCGAGCTRTIRRYELVYSGRTQSFLDTVRGYGENGEALPPVTLRYVDAGPPGEQRAGQRKLAGAALRGGAAQFEDLNADGLPDLVIGSASSGWSWQRNVGGGLFEEARPLGKSPDVRLSDTTRGVVLLDVDGDGYRDVVRLEPRGFAFFGGGYREESGEYKGFSPVQRVDVGASVTGFDWSAAENRVMDLNGDGRTDVLQVRAGRATALLNLPGNDGAGTRFAVKDLGALPSDVLSAFNDTSGMFSIQDMNGDGAMDLVMDEMARVSGRPSYVRVWYGLGSGKYLASRRFVAPAASGDKSFLVDVNDDGYVDVVRLVGSQVRTWLNAGDETFAAAQAGTGAIRTPSGIAYEGVLDVDGDGAVDHVFVADDGTLTYTPLTTPHHGLLKTIDNGMGKVIEITYASSSEYAAKAARARAAWRYPLPKPMSVVAEVVVRDSLNLLNLPESREVTQYEYRDGYYDAGEKEFRGFGYVKVTEVGDDHDETQVTETYFHLGTEREGDPEVFKGRAYLEVVSGAAGEIYATEETHWERKWLCRDDAEGLAEYAPDCTTSENRDERLALAFPRAKLRGSFERLPISQARWTLEAAEFDAWGRVTRLRRFGEVHPPQGRALGEPFWPALADAAPDGDEAEETHAYADNLERWTLGLPTMDRKLDPATGVTLTETHYHYDGPAFQGLPLGEVTDGKLTRTSRWYREENRFIDVERHAYDAFGMLVATRDALGNETRLRYDPETGTHAEREEADVAGGVIVFTAAYDKATGAPIAVTDANGLTTEFKYDGLGRLVAGIDPLSDENTPTTVYEYTFGTATTPVSTVTTRQLVDRTTRKYRSSVSYADGLGRTRLSKVHGDAADVNTYVATGWVELGARGSAVKTYDAFVSRGLGLEAAPASTPVTEQFFDAQGRTTRVFAPPRDGQPRAYTETEYAPFETRSYDEADTLGIGGRLPAVTTRDGLGRERVVTKQNVDPRTGEHQTLAWTYAYNALGNVTGWTDPLGHSRVYTYDSLSRLTAVVDPNLTRVRDVRGELVPIRYKHDDVGNLVARIDPLGQTTRFVFGAGNRLTHILVEGDVAGRPDYAYAYHYDAPDPSGPVPAARNLVGHVSWVEWPTGSSHFSYDEAGRLERHAESLWNPAVSPETAQVRDVFERSQFYDASGAVTELRLPGDRVFRRTYTERGLLAGVSMATATSPPKALVASVAYAPNGRVRRTEHGNGTATCAWYNLRSELVALATAAATSLLCAEAPREPVPDAIQHVAYDRDVVGDLRRVTDLTASQAFPKLDAEYSYDRLHQLVVARTPRGTDEYAYDAIQNVRRHTSTSRTTQATALLGELRYGDRGAGPSMLTSAVSDTGEVVASLDYDALGNLKRYRGYDLAFNVEGKLVEARGADGKRIRYFYDDDGERKITVVEPAGGGAPTVYRHVFEDYWRRGDEEIWSIGAGSTAVEIAKKPGDPETIRYTHKDLLGGTSYQSDATGVAVGLQTYEPSGQLDTRIGGRAPLHGFAGSETEADEDLGLLRFGKRYYAPGIGRWISADRTIGEAPHMCLSRPLEANLYAYAMNNPVSYVDKTGEFLPVIVVAILVAAAVIATPQYANAPASASSPTYHKSAPDLALDMTHNAVMAVGAAEFATVAAGTVAAEGVLVGGAKVAGAVAYGHAVGTGVHAVTDTVDPSGRLGKVADIAMVVTPSAPKNAAGARVVPPGPKQVLKAVSKPATRPAPRPKARSGGESAAAKDGRRAHNNYGTALGSEYETEVVLPSGKRADAVHKTKPEVRELKPDNPRAVRRGQKQVDAYARELESIDPQKRQWTGIVDTYQPKK